MSINAFCANIQIFDPNKLTFQTVAESTGLKIIHIAYRIHKFVAAKSHQVYYCCTADKIMFGLWYPLDRIRRFLSIVRLCNWYEDILLWLFLGFIVLAYSMSNIFIVLAKFPCIFFIGLYLHWRKEDQKLELELQIQNFAWAKFSC